MSAAELLNSQGMRKGVGHYAGYFIPTNFSQGMFWLSNRLLSILFVRLSHPVLLLGEETWVEIDSHLECYNLQLILDDEEWIS